METDALVREALGRYALTDPEVRFIRHNENITHRVIAREGDFLLRIHRPVEGFSLSLFASAAESRQTRIEGELRMLQRLRAARFPAQCPVANAAGDWVTTLSGDTPATLLTWLEGEPLDKVPMTPELALDLGGMIARLHASLRPPLGQAEDIPRYRYDATLLRTMHGELTAAASAGHLDAENEAVFHNTLDEIARRMAELDARAGTTGLTHADLSPGNLLQTGRGLVPIDFSLSGHGYLAMDQGMALTQYKEAEIQRQILAGYERERGNAVALRYVEPFYALGILLFVASQHAKFHAVPWFRESLGRWSRTAFTPLLRGEPFLAADPRHPVE